MRFFQFLVLTLIIQSSTLLEVNGQPYKLDELYSIAIPNLQLVNKAPLKWTVLDIRDRYLLRRSLKRDKIEIDSSILVQLIQRRALPDTAPWTQGELQHAVLISKGTQWVSKRLYKRRLKKETKSNQEAFRLEIDWFNKSRGRYLNSYSRPVFDDSGQFAVIELDSVGGGTVWLFRFDGQHWIKLGTLTDWVS